MAWPIALGSVVGSVLGALTAKRLSLRLMVAIFVYSSLASAGILYPVGWPLSDSNNWVIFSVREWLDLTEMEAFRWWPFNLLIGLLCATLIVVTLKRIPLNRIKFGVWMIHTGIITLACGSVYYFSTKIEGDAPVFRRRAVIRLPGSDETATLLIRPGAQVTLGSGATTYQVAVFDIIPDYTLLSEAHKGEEAYTVQLSITTPTDQFVRQLHAGYPQYTEDVVLGQGRAIKAIGRKLVDEELDIRLEYEPQEFLYLQDSFALYVRGTGEAEWTERPIEGMPRYHERIGSPTDVWWSSPHVNPVSLPIAAGTEKDALDGYDVLVTGFLPYAVASTRWVGGGEQLNPVVGIRVDDGHQVGREFELAALIPQMSSIGNGLYAFRWVESLADLERLARPANDRLIIRIPDTDIEFDAEIPDSFGADVEPPWNEIAGTDYAYRVRNIIRGLEVRGRRVDVATVNIRSGDREFTRMAANPLDATKDMAKDHQFQPPDPGIEMVLEAGSGNNALVTIVAGPEPVGLRVLYPTGEEAYRHQQATIGEPVQLAAESRITLTRMFSHAVTEERPEVVHTQQRRTAMGGFFSMVQVKLTKDNFSRSLWLKFSRYALANRQYEVPGRMFYRTEHVQLANGESVELMFSRERMRLPTPVVLDDFQLLTHTGGFTGSTNTVRDFVSTVRFASDEAPDGWAERMMVASNSPSENNGLWYFQSTWDPPLRSTREDNLSKAGMNYTGLGIGNRNGVHIQLAGTALAVLGMIYTFYVKPMIIRRRMTEAQRGMRSATTVEEAIEEPQPVLTS
ncbi:MAG: hypothetical protein IH988_06480 [Planctomycetes bacterium]|nr:hypothetical protein [Planctomycetota bacterium]